MPSHELSPEQQQALEYLCRELAWYVDQIHETCERYGVNPERVQIICRDPGDPKNVLLAGNEAAEDLPGMCTQILAFVQDGEGRYGR